MAPKPKKSIIVSSSNAPLASELAQPLEVFMNVYTASVASSSAPTEVGRLVFRLFRETHPRTCENFRLLSMGTVIPADKKAGKDQRLYSFANTPFTRVTEDGIQGGNIHKLFDVQNRHQSTSAPTPATHVLNSSTLSGGRQASAGQQRSPSPAAGAAKGVIPESQLQSIYGPVFADEAKSAVPKGYGALSMCNSGPDSNGCQFFICTRKPHPTNLEITQFELEHLTKNYVAFGQLVEGAEVLELLVSSMAALATNEAGELRGSPTVYFIGSCGVIGIDAPVPASSGKR